MNCMTKINANPNGVTSMLATKKIPYYFLGILLVVSLLTPPLFSHAAQGPNSLIFQPKTLHQKLLLHPSNLVIIDIRTPEAYLAGHIPMAINLPVTQLHQMFNQSNKDQWLSTKMDNTGSVE